MLRIVILVSYYLEDTKMIESFKKDERSKNSNFRIRKRKKYRKYNRRQKAIKHANEKKKIPNSILFLTALFSSTVNLYFLSKNMFQINLHL